MDMDVTITRPDVEIYMIFDCLKGLLCLWVGTMIIEQYSTLNRRDCLWFWGGDALIFGNALRLQALPGS
jgi:hypothetical protein